MREDVKECLTKALGDLDEGEYEIALKRICKKRAIISQTGNKWNYDILLEVEKALRDPNLSKARVVISEKLLGKPPA